jgi:nucleotide-binding universal stress UspA family protein
MSEAGAFSAVPTKILVPIDFSSSSHAALDAATEFAEKFDAEVFLLSVIPAFPDGTLPDSVVEAQIIEKGKQEAEKRFAVSVKALSAKSIKVTSSIEVGNDIASSILDAVDNHKIDLVVLSTHGLSGWYPTVFGSIAEKIVKLAPCPVYLLRTPKPPSSSKVSSSRLMEWW